MIWLLLATAVCYYAYSFLFPPTETEESKEAQPVPPPLNIPPVPVPSTTTFSPRDKIAGVVESLNWCNDITRICWPQAAKIIESQLSPTLEPLINLYLPKPFSNFRFVKAKLGKNPLTVKRVAVHRRFQDSITMDVDVMFVGNPNISMKCAPVSATVGIKELRWTGRLSILMRPLLTSLPLIGAVQVSMITHPELQMDFTGVANLAEIGPLERIVKMVLKNVISSMIVLPNRFLYKLTDSVDYFKVYHAPIGIISVAIERGRGFTKEKKLGLIKVIPDLYCKATFALEEMKTNVQMNNVAPFWGESKSFILSDIDQCFKLNCYDKDTISRDDLVGSMSIKAEDLLLKGNNWYPFATNIDKKIARTGQVLLNSELFTFEDPKEPVRGLCVLSILIDRAKDLPEKTKTAACKVTVGNVKHKTTRLTPKISKPDTSIPGIDPINPIWSFSFDILCEDYVRSDVQLEVVDGKTSIGCVRICMKELQDSDSKVKAGTFDLKLSDSIVKAGDIVKYPAPSLRAKVILRGLIPGQLPAKESQE